MERPPTWKHRRRARTRPGPAAPRGPSFARGRVGRQHGGTRVSGGALGPRRDRPHHRPADGNPAHRARGSRQDDQTGNDAAGGRPGGAGVRPAGRRPGGRPGQDRPAHDEGADLRRRVSPGAAGRRGPGPPGTGRPPVRAGPRGARVARRPGGGRGGMTDRDLRGFEALEGPVAAAVDLFVAERPRAIALSGGSPPKPVYEHLATIDYPWSDVDVFFGDERCVPPDHPDSNFRMANEALLSKIETRVHPMDDCDAHAYERTMRDVFGDVDWPRLDLDVLGIGDDGHTASLFPGKPALDVTDRWVVYVPEPGMPPPHPRLTMTFPVHDASRLALFLVSGEGKRERLRQLMAGDDIPAARIAAERVIVLADRAAAG